MTSSTVNGTTSIFEYDAAGRMIEDGEKTYTYGWLDKVMSITQNKKITNTYNYSMNGQIASANISGKQESFLWDGLALIKRGTTEYVYEPAVTGGNPILANGKAMFNDMLGNTLGAIGEKDKFTAIKRSAFGQTLENKAGKQYNMFTGKPQIGGLGYAFLFRNYRPNLGKWQTQDPMGYPDGWNNFAYVNNRVTNYIDYTGQWTLQIGFSFFGGGGSGGTVSEGLAISYSAEGGFQFGTFSNGGGGALIGGGGSVTLDVTVSGNQTIDLLNGLATTLGGSVGEGVNIGGKFNIPTDPNASTTATFSIGAGVGLPAEQHTFITTTLIEKIWQSGGIVTTITPVTE